MLSNWLSKILCPSPQFFEIVLFNHDTIPKEENLAPISQQQCCCNSWMQALSHLNRSLCCCTVMACFPQSGSMPAWLAILTRSWWSIGISLRQVFCWVGCSANDWQLSASLKHQHTPFLRLTERTHFYNLNEWICHSLSCHLSVLFFIFKLIFAAVLEFWYYRHCGKCLHQWINVPLHAQKTIQKINAGIHRFL